MKLLSVRLSRSQLIIKINKVIYLKLEVINKKYNLTGFEKEPHRVSYYGRYGRTLITLSGLGFENYSNKDVNVHILDQNNKIKSSKVLSFN